LADSKSPPKGDVFKYALFKIIGKCELQIKSIRNPDVIATTDDYLWLQMMLMNEDATKIDDIERYSLADFSKKMQKLGLAHFKTTTVWFMVLLLCGEFELAVFELSKDPYFTHDAMHFAIALAYYGVLRVPDNPKSLPAAGTLISSTQIMLEGNSHTINYFHFARMIAKFVKRWIESMPSEALHYLYMIGLYGATDNPKSPTLNKSGVSSTGSEYRKFSYSLIREILVDYRNFGQLLGQLKADGGGRIPGHIEIYRSLIQLSSEQEFLNLVVFPSAQDAENESRFSDAIQLYHLGGDFNRVLELLIRKLGETLLQHTMEDFAEKAVGQVQSTQKGLPLIDSDPVESAEQVLKFYMSHQQYASLIEPQTSSTCQTLIQLYQCRAQLARGIDESGLNIFYGLGIIPDSTDMGEIQRKAESFNELDESIARVIPQMMVLVSQSLYKLYRSLLEKSGLFQVSKESRLQKIRERSRVLLMFAGQVQYRIPSDVFAKMNRVDVMMG
jgi:nuclear pore complex protein Nup93